MSNLKSQRYIIFTALFSNDDVEGQDIFKFKSRHTKLDLQNKVKATISSSPKLVESPLKTPRKSFLKGINSPFSKLTEATPKYVKDVMKKSKPFFLSYMYICMFCTIIGKLHARLKGYS